MTAIATAAVAATTATTKVAATAKVTGKHNNQKVTGTHNNQIIEAAERNGGGGSGNSSGGCGCDNNQLKAETVVAVIMQPWCCDRTMFSSTSPFSSLTCGGIHSEKRKGRKSQFLFTAQLLRKTNLAEIFSEARSGTIAHKNKKRITAVTQCRVRLQKQYF
jgi:hypothetical protein